MDNTVRKLNIGNTDYNFPQGFPIIAGYSSYGRTRIDLTQNFSLPFTTRNFGFSDTFPRNTSTITAAEAVTEIKKHRPLIFKWDWYDTESSGDEHFITAELYPVDGNLYQFRAIVPITVYRGVTTTYISRIDMSLVSHTFSYTYITTIPGGLNDLSNVTITTPTDGQGIKYDATTQTWVNGNNYVELTQAEYDALEQAGEVQANTQYYITDGTGGGVQSLDDLDDVNISTPADGDLLVYDANTNEWVNISGSLAYVTYGDVSAYDLITHQIISHNFTTVLGILGIGSGGIQNWFNSESLQGLVDHGNACHYEISIDNLNAGRRRLKSIAEYTRLYNATTHTWIDTASLIGAIDQMLQDPNVYTQIEASLYFANSTTAFDKLVLTANSTDTHFTFGSFTTVTDIYS